MQAYPGAVRAASISIGDLYPEAKGPAPSTYQLANPHEVAAAAGQGGAAVLASVPPIDPRQWGRSPVVWIAVAVLLLFLMGARR